MTFRQKAYLRLIKRPIGLLGALLALVLLTPLFFGTMVLLFFANKNSFRGIFFTQSRLGKNGNVFRVIKFKSMTDERDAEEKLLPDKERLTKIGQFVRSTSIDELPQLINILKGDMAFIGPRPLTPVYLKIYTKEQARRMEVTPGISGWAQVNGRQHCLLSKKFEYDVWYVDHISLAVDAKIFFMTVANVFMRKDVGEGSTNFEDFDDLGYIAKIKELKNKGEA